MPRRNVRRGGASAGGGRVGGGGRILGKTTGVCSGSSRFFGGCGAFSLDSVAPSMAPRGAEVSPFVVAGAAVLFAPGTDIRVSYCSAHLLLRKGKRDIVLAGVGDASSSGPWKKSR